MAEQEHTAEVSLVLTCPRDYTGSQALVLGHSASCLRCRQSENYAPS